MADADDAAREQAIADARHAFTTRPCTGCSASRCASPTTPIRASSSSRCPCGRRRSTAPATSTGAPSPRWSTSRAGRARPGRRASTRSPRAWSPPISHVRYLGRPKGDVVRAEARVMRAGRMLIVVEIRVLDPLDNVIAFADFSAMVVAPPGAAAGRRGLRPDRSRPVARRSSPRRGEVRQVPRVRCYVAARSRTNSRGGDAHDAWRLADLRQLGLELPGPLGPRARGHHLDRAALLLQLRAGARRSPQMEAGGAQQGDRQARVPGAVVVPLGRRRDVRCSGSCWSCIPQGAGGKGMFTPRRLLQVRARASRSPPACCSASRCS